MAGSESLVDRNLEWEMKKWHGLRTAIRPLHCKGWPNDSLSLFVRCALLREGIVKWFITNLPCLQP
jgi:hypothetical protein